MRRPSSRCHWRRVVWSRNAPHVDAGLSHFGDKHELADRVTAEAAAFISDELWNKAHEAMQRRARTFLRLQGKILGRPESFRGTHLLSNVARCAVCGAPLHYVQRGQSKATTGLRPGLVCAANRKGGPVACLNGSFIPAAELNDAVVRALHRTFTVDSFTKYLADKANNPAEADARHAELAHLQDVVLPGLALREERLLDAIEAGAIDREQAKKRGQAIRDERGVAEAKRDELLTRQRNEIADTEQATTMASNWNG